MLTVGLRLLRYKSFPRIVKYRTFKNTIITTMSNKGQRFDSDIGEKPKKGSRNKNKCPPTDNRQTTLDAHFNIKSGASSDNKDLPDCKSEQASSMGGKIMQGFKGFLGYSSPSGSDGSDQRKKRSAEKRDWDRKNALEKRQSYLDMPIKEKRELYRRRFVEYTESTFKGADSPKPGSEKSPYEKIAVWEGDITKLEFDAIVNAANESLRGGGGVDGAIHSAAGGDLLKECVALYPDGCETGDAKITGGYRLPARYVIHTVGPRNRSEKQLRCCYESVLSLVKDEQYGIKTVAIPCISTGIFGYPNEEAAVVALQTVLDWLIQNPDWNGRVVFCVFLSVDKYLYNEYSRNIFAGYGVDIQEDKSNQMSDTQTEESGPHKNSSTSATTQSQQDSESVSPESTMDISSQSVAMDQDMEEEVADGTQGAATGAILEEEGGIKHGAAAKDGIAEKVTGKNAAKNQPDLEVDASCNQSDHSDKMDESENITGKDENSAIGEQTPVAPTMEKSERSSGSNELPSSPDIPGVHTYKKKNEVKQDTTPSDESRPKDAAGRDEPTANINPSEGNVESTDGNPQSL